LPDLSEILHGKQFFSQNFGNGTDIRVPHRIFFVYLMHFGLQRAAAFVSSPIHLLLEKRANLIQKWYDSCRAGRTDGVVYIHDFCKTALSDFD